MPRAHTYHLFLQALAVKKKELKPNDVHNAPIFYELAKCYFACGTVDKAILCYKEAHRIWKSHKDLNQAGNASFELVSITPLLPCTSMLQFYAVILY